ncbi:MAG: aminotransferase class I/II-fold pyridoxal phosphate-dependent enzyme [Planctomycetes bacterium]|nr:aminotransferase class I/II-fold pyridoxal phosphate-dependent enzyme [Planctomycetota bacterium]
MNKLAEDLNQTILTNAPDVFNMLSSLGKELYFPKGILSQTAEAKQKATHFNATIGIAKEGKEAMFLPSVMKQFSDHIPNDLLPYAPTTGKPELRNKWMEQILIKNPTLKGKSVSLPIVTSGITHGLSLAADLFVDRGDILLLPQQFWGNYNMIFGVRHGANVKHHRFFSHNNGFDTDDLRRVALESASSGKLIVILNFPNNPTGYSVTKSEAKAIRDVLVEVAEEGCNVVAVCDDSYFGLFYEDNVCKESVFAYLANQHPRLLAVKLDGATKEDYVWGFRVGFITFATTSGNSEVYDALEKKTGGAIRGNISNCPLNSQTIVLKAMLSEKYNEEKLCKFTTLKTRAAKVKEVLSNKSYSSVWAPYPFNSGYFMCLKLNGIDAEQFRCSLLDKYGIGVIATGKEDIRVAFSCVEENDIPLLFDQMYQCAIEMQKASG